MLSLLPLPLLLLPLLLWPSYICQVRPRTVFFLFELCCHAWPCAVPNHPWLFPTSVGVLRQSWPRQGRKPPTAGRKTTANGWLIDFSAHPARRPKHSGQNALGRRTPCGPFCQKGPRSAQTKTLRPKCSRPADPLWSLLPKGTAEGDKPKHSGQNALAANGCQRRCWRWWWYCRLHWCFMAANGWRCRCCGR